MDERQDVPGLYSWINHGLRFYEDRRDAGASLANHLLHHAGHDALVLAIPHGGVPVAYEIAARLDADLDVIVACKIGAPEQNELAIGAVTADGTRTLNEQLLTQLGISASTLEQATLARRAQAIERESRFRKGLPSLNVGGRTVIIVDDGLATGATMRAAVRAVRSAGAKKVVVAAPVGAVETCAELAAEVDELVCPRKPEPFYAVGAHYQSFMQVADREVERLLREHRQRRAARAQSTTPAEVVQPPRPR